MVAADALTFTLAFPLALDRPATPVRSSAEGAEPTDEEGVKIGPTVRESSATLAASDDPDLSLLRRTAAGDDDAFAELVGRHQDRLLRLCQRLLGRRDEALDAVQDVFLKVYRKAGSYEPRGKVYTWMYRIATNHCFNQLRRRKIVRFVGLERTAADDEDDGYSIDPADPASSPEQALQARRRWRATRRLIENLPESQRAVLVLAKFEGLSYREIAEVLQITESAVESRLFRAMRRLSQAREALG